MWKVRSKVNGLSLGVTFLKDVDSNELVFNNKEHAETAAHRMTESMNPKGFGQTYMYWAVRV